VLGLSKGGKENGEKEGAGKEIRKKQLIVFVHNNKPDAAGREKAPIGLTNIMILKEHAVSLPSCNARMERAGECRARTEATMLEAQGGRGPTPILVVENVH
jgi:hypothetical protein